MDTNNRAVAFGTQLIETHDWLRDHVAQLRTDLEAGANQPRKLQAHCQAFCFALTQHHTGEDGGFFPALAKQFPELEPVLAELRRDHEQITVLLHRLEALDFTDPAAARRELNGIQALMESHFGYEERKIVNALNELELELS